MWQEIQKLITDNEIFSIDIRYVGVTGSWQGLTLPASTVLNLEDINKVCKELQLQPFMEKEQKDGNCYFIDPFLAHRTLVLLTPLKSEKQVTLKNTNNSYNLEFYLELPAQVDNDLTNFSASVTEFMAKDVINKGNKKLAADNMSYQLLSPPEDIWRDIRSEIVLALGQMSVNILQHYARGADCTNVVKLATSNNNYDQVNNIQKVKYAILMVAKAYNIKVDKSLGIFKDFKNPYENILKD